MQDQCLLKDGGIKAKIIKQYIPVINKLINKYLAIMELPVGFELDECDVFDSGHKFLKCPRRKPPPRGTFELRRSMRTGRGKSNARSNCHAAEGFKKRRPAAVAERTLPGVHSRPSPAAAAAGARAARARAASSRDGKSPAPRAAAPPPRSAA